jgi:hypothetical protein
MRTSTANTLFSNFAHRDRDGSADKWRLGLRRIRRDVLPVHSVRNSRLVQTAQGRIEAGQLLYVFAILRVKYTPHDDSAAFQGLRRSLPAVSLGGQLRGSFGAGIYVAGESRSASSLNSA